LIQRFGSGFKKNIQTSFAEKMNLDRKFDQII